MTSAGDSSFPPTTGGTRTSRARRSIRSRTPSSTSSAEHAESHPDFGPPPYGIPYVGVGSTQAARAGDLRRLPRARATTGFGGETGYPIPEAAKTQANFIEGGVPGGARAAIGTCSSSIATDGCSSSCSPTRWNAARSGGRRDRAPCSTCRRTRGARTDGRRPMPPAWPILPGLVRYDEADARADPTRASGHRSPDERLRVARLTSRRQHMLARSRWARGFA